VRALAVNTRHPYNSRGRREQPRRRSRPGPACHPPSSTLGSIPPNPSRSAGANGARASSLCRFRPPRPCSGRPSRIFLTWRSH